MIQQHQAQVITSADDEDVHRVHICQSHLLADALRQFSKIKFDVAGQIYWRRGCGCRQPNQRIFHLLMQEIFKFSLFEGYPIYGFLYIENLPKT